MAIDIELLKSAVLQQQAELSHLSTAELWSRLPGTAELIARGEAVFGGEGSAGAFARLAYAIALVTMVAGPFLLFGVRWTFKRTEQESTECSS